MGTKGTLRLGAKLSAEPVNGHVHSNHQLWSTWGGGGYRTDMLEQQQPRAGMGKGWDQPPHDSPFSGP